jgi:GntR family transcriptional regulator, transcriptional repressor for pyruvate dehydrogenase complex
MTLDAIARSPSLVEKVCDQLAKIIRHDQEEDDGWLPTERELSAQLGVSRSVVREAAKRLESQGLVEIQHGIGIKAVDKLHKPLNGSLALLIPDAEERLRQLNETRMAIEPESARLAAENATPAQLRTLRRIHQQLLDAPDNAHAIKADMAFHRALAEASGNQMFRLILDSLAEIGFASRQRTIGRVGKFTGIEHHAAILEAVERGDSKAAVAAMRHHITCAGEDMQLREKSPRSRK